ncbi:MAG TPA: alpha/beta hydrolase [Hanamia sp.]|nr:alpha/beta hydrolase [Hanamia sp.]
MPHIVFRNKKIFYRIEGKGKPVLLLHGFGEYGNIWNHQIKTLSKNYCLIIPDLPGSGKSEMLKGNCTLEDYAEVIKAITDESIFKEKKEKQFSLIGHSMGGYITLAFAEKYPKLLNSLGLFHSSAFADDEQKKATRRNGIEFIKKNGSEAFLKTAIPNLFSEQTKKENPGLLTQLLTISKDISPEVLIQYYEAMILRPDRTSVLKSFSKPILFICGKFDTVVPLEASLKQVQLPTLIFLHILKNSAHVGMWEEDRISSKYLLEFFTEIYYKFPQ